MAACMVVRHERASDCVPRQRYGRSALRTRRLAQFGAGLVQSTHAHNVLQIRVLDGGLAADKRHNRVQTDVGGID